MKFKVKVLKRMISIVCALSISASTLGTSVSAIRVPQNASDGVVNGVNGLNNIIEQGKDSLSRIKGKLDYLCSSAHKKNISEETQKKLEELSTMVDSSIKEFYEVDSALDCSVIFDINFITEVRQKLEDISLKIFDLSEKSKDIYKLDVNELDVNELDAMDACAKDIFVQLEKIEKEADKRAENNNFGDVEYYSEKEQDEMLKQRIEQILNEGKMFDEDYKDDLSKRQTMKKIFNILLKDRFNDRKQGAEYIFGFINRAHMGHDNIAKTLKQIYVFHIVYYEVVGIYDNYRNNGGGLFAAELDKAISRSDILKAAIDYADRQSNENSTFDELVERAREFVKRVFGDHIDSVDKGVDEGVIEGLRAKINLIRRECCFKQGIFFA